MKWDGFRAVVSTEDGFRVRSRRGWNMAPLNPELARDDVRGVFDGELVASREGIPHFPNVTARMLHAGVRSRSPLRCFDVLSLDGEQTTSLPYAERRELARAWRRLWFLPPVFDDGPSLFAAVCEQCSRVWWRSGATRSTVPAIEAGSKSRTEATGGSTMSGNWRYRCGEGV